MEVTRAAPAGGSFPEGSGATLLRDPLFWAAASGFAGTGLGLFGLFRQAALRDSFYVDPISLLLARVPTFAGEALVMSSTLGVVFLVWGVLGRAGRRVAVAGMVLLALLVAGAAFGIASVVYWSTGDRWQGYAGFPFPVLQAATLQAAVFLPVLILLCFAGLALAARELRLGVLLLCLALLATPYWVVWLLLFPPEPANYADSIPGLVPFLLGWYSTGTSLPEAPLWALVGLTLLRRARSQARGGASRTRERENLEAARCLYEEGLARGDVSVVDGLVSEDFRDLGRGSRGKLAMERVFSALWKTYPDLSVSIEAQEAKDDLVKTRLSLSGTDRGGVLWYPPTGKRATFTAEFTDRFHEGKLVEHSGKTDTESLLHQLGLV